MSESLSTATPLGASAASVVAPANLSNPNIATARRRPTNYNPTISAMLALSRCDDMVKMAQECLATGSNATICHTAERYMGACMDHTKWDSSESGPRRTLNAASNMHRRFCSPLAWFTAVALNRWHCGLPFLLGALFGSVFETEKRYHMAGICYSRIHLSRCS